MLKEPTKSRTSKAPNRHSIVGWHVKANALAILAILLSISGSQVLAGNGSVPRLASADWSVVGPTSVGVRPPSLAEVQAFMNYLRQAAYPVGYFRFANLRNTGTLSLVTCVNQGSGFDDYIDIIDKGPAGFTLYEIEQSTMASAGDDYSKLLADLDGTGVYELIVQHDLATYVTGGMGYFCLWPMIYKWNGSGYVEVSGQFKSYYQHRLQTLQKELARMPVNHRLPACFTTAESAKTERFLGLDTSAGLGDAMKCAEIAKVADRELGLGLLADLGNPPALAQIQILTHDPNKEISHYSQIILIRLAEGWRLQGPRLVSIIIPCEGTNTNSGAGGRTAKPLLARKGR
jgi:hypothetical protein